MFTQRLYRSLILPTAFFLSACGGDGGSDSEDTELSVTLGEDLSVKPALTISLTPENVEYEGDITYSWVQTSGTNIAIEGASTSSISFNSPPPSDIPLQFTLTVTDDSGNVAEDTISITVEHEFIRNYRRKSDISYSSGRSTYCEKYQYEGLYLSSIETTFPGDDNLCGTSDDQVSLDDSYQVDLTITQTSLSSKQYYPTKENAEYCEFDFNEIVDSTLVTYSLANTINCDSETIDHMQGEAYIYEVTLQDGIPVSEQRFDRTQNGDITTRSHSTYNYNASTQLESTDYYIDEGEDGVWGTADDVRDSHNDYYYNNEGYLTHYIERTGENLEDIYGVYIYKHDETGLLTDRYDYSSPGEDEDWLTEEDNDLESHITLERVNIYPLTRFHSSDE